MKTVFDNELKGWTNFSENQLLRCKNQKIYEGELLLNIHHGASFLDIGANYGDTVCTMAAYAKSKNRSDIRFYAFEPNIKKIKHIEKISTLNNLNITVYNSCVGYERTNAIFDKIVNENAGAASFKLDTNGPHKIIRLDDIKSELEPIGYIHIDTEGWDCAVLKGSREILLSPENSPCYIVAECWTDDVAKQQMTIGRAKGVATNTPKKDILDEMKSYSDIQLIHELKYKDVNELNLVFKKGTQHETGDITIGPEGSHVEMMEANSTPSMASGTDDPIIYPTTLQKISYFDNTSNTVIERISDEDSK